MTPRSCPACGGHQSTVVVAPTADQFCSINATYVRDYDRVLGIRRNAVFPIDRCCDCEFVFAKLLPTAEFLACLYRDVIDRKIGAYENADPAWIAHQLRLAADLVGAIWKAKMRILDFGCGRGVIVNALNSSRIECVGYDAHDPSFASEPVGPFDGVILSDVLEHMPEPRNTLRRCRDLMAPDAALIINVPNFNGELRSFRSDRNVNPWEHLNYFSPRSLRDMVRREGFDIREFPDFGLRPGLDGIRKWGNGVKSAFRLLAHLSGRVDSTRILAFKR